MGKRLGLMRTHRCNASASTHSCLPLHTRPLEQQTKSSLSASIFLPNRLHLVGPHSGPRLCGQQRSVPTHLSFTVGTLLWKRLGKEDVALQRCLPGTSVAASPARKRSVVQMAKKAEEYDMKMRLREELEAPFRKVRMTLYAASAASATVGAFVAGSRVIAALSGIEGVQPLSETIPNFGIDVGVILGGIFLYTRDVKAGERRLERMARGAMVGSLNIEINNGKVIKVSDLRGSRRVLIVAGNAQKVQDILKAGAQFQDRLTERDLVVVPVAFNKVASFEDLSSGWSGQGIAQAIDVGTWKLWGEEEAKKVRAKDIENDVFMTIIRKDGKVGARSARGLAWERLLADFDTLPKKDKYGTP